MNKFRNAIAGKDRISVIAEIKRRSPSHGPFEKHSPEKLVIDYRRAGADAISVVTDRERFDGSIELLEEVVKTSHLPVLRKDFIRDEKQIDVTADAGASAVLLIARDLEPRQLYDLTEHALHRGLDPLIELHDRADLEKVRGMRHVCLGINNRNLSTLATDVNYGKKMIGSLPPENPIVIESGFFLREQLEMYRGKVNAALIGTALLTAEDPRLKLMEFTQARSE